jgi:hypothetical protein
MMREDGQWKTVHTELNNHQRYVKIPLGVQTTALRLTVKESNGAESGTALPAEDLAALGADLKRVWYAPRTDARLKKRVVRTVIQEVIADIDDAASEIVLLVHWMGGAHTEIRLPKRRRDSAMRHRQMLSMPSASLRASPATMSSPGR